MKDEIIILDSNIWISYIISRQLHTLAEMIISKNLNIVTCQVLVEEIRGVLHREKFRKYISKNDVVEAVNIHLKLCRYIDIELKTDLLSDKKDNFLIDLYKSANATMLVSGDKQLLIQARLYSIKAVTLKQFETGKF